MGAYCLRSAYAVFERVLTPKIEARKLLFYFYFFTHSFTLPDLTSAFGGWRSIQLSYGCLTRHLVQPLPPRNPKAVGGPGMGHGSTRLGCSYTPDAPAALGSDDPPAP